MDMSKIDTSSARPYRDDETARYPLTIGIAFALVALPWLLLVLLGETAQRYATALVRGLRACGEEWHRARAESRQS